MGEFLKKVVSNTAFLQLASANMIANGTTFAILLLLSAMVSPAAFGMLSISISVLVQLSLLLDLGTGIALVRCFSAERDAAKAERFVVSAFQIRLLATVLFSGVVFSAWFFAFDWISEWRESGLYCAVFAAIVVIAWWNLVRSINQARQDFRIYAISLIGLATFRIGGVAALILLNKEEPPVDKLIWIMYVVAPLMVSLLVLIMPRRSGILSLSSWFQVDPEVTPVLLHYGKWIFLSALLFPLSTHIPLWLLGATSSLEAAGTLGIGIYFANAIAPIREAIRVYMLPKVVAFNDVSALSNYVNAILKAMLAGIPIALAIGMLAVIAQSAINGSRYDQSSAVILVMVFVQVATLFTGLIGNVLHHFGRPEYDVLVNICRVFFAALLSGVWVSHNGAVSAALVVALTTLVGEFMIVRKVLKDIASARLQGEWL